MSIVSSFCGPQGLIWGYDLASNIEKKKLFEGLENFEYKGKKLKVHDGTFLIEALEELFGNVNDKRYYLKPGSHVPFASKNIKVNSPCEIYSAICIAIPKDREINACLLMEDVGLFNEENEELSIATNLAKSIVNVGINQKVEYEECLVLIKHDTVGENQTGCALVAAPYFTVAQNAIPKNFLGKRDFENLKIMSLKQWKEAIYK
jgi:histidine decarboxylase